MISVTQANKKAGVFLIHLSMIALLLGLSILWRRTGVHLLLLAAAYSSFLFVGDKRLKMTGVFLALAFYAVYCATDYVLLFSPRSNLNYNLLQQVFAFMLPVAGFIFYSISAGRIRVREMRLHETEQLILRKSMGHDVVEARLNNSNQNLNQANNTLTQMVRDKTRAFQTFLEAIDVNIPLSITDAEGLIIQVNKPFTDLCQYSEEELIGKNHNIINSGLHPDEFFGDFWNTISAGKKWKGELHNTAKDGTNYWVDIVVIPLLSLSGEIQQFISLQFPITNKKHIQTKKDLYIRSLEEMAFITSHKIRKPVTNIKGMVSIIEDIDLDKSEFSKIKEYLKTSSEELDSFTFELNDFIYNQIKSESVNV